MGQVGMQLAVVAKASQNFSEGLAQNVASAMYNIPMGAAAGGSGRRCLIRAIRVETDENFGPEFNFFSSATGLTTDPDTDGFLGRFGFVSAMGEQLSASGLFRYYVDGLAIPYHDIDVTTGGQPQTLHVILQNISLTAKNARGAGSGRCQATFWLEPEQPW